MPEKDALEEKLDEIAGHWEAFARDPGKTLLRWMVEPTDVEIADLFFDVQASDAGNLPDLFLVFDEPFTNIDSYPDDLVRSLNLKYGQIRPDLEKENISAGWECPKLHRNETPPERFQRCVASFYDYYKDLMRNLAVVLRPSNLSDASRWQAWLRVLARSRLRTQVRYAVLDDALAPALDRLCELEPNPIFSQKLHIDHPGLMADLARGTEPGPGADFRVLFVKLSNQVSSADLNGAEQTAARALEIAESHDWLPMQVVVHATLAAAYLQKRQTQKALEAYKKGTAAARRAQEQGDPAGPKLVLQCTLAEASVLFAEQRYRDAAELYMTLCPLALAQGDHHIVVEGWRMAAYCYEMEEALAKSIQCGAKALEAAEKMPPEDRPNSTLPYVGQGLIRVIQKEETGTPLSQDQVKDNMIALCGADWESRLVGSAPDPGAHLS